ncbi:MAG: serine hydrolase [Bacteroidota bacterium]
MKTRYFLLALVLVTVLSSCKLGRFVVYNYANITDHKIFPKNELDKSAAPFSFQQVANKIPYDSLSVTRKGVKKRVSFEDFLEKNKTVAFLIIHNDTIEYEEYFAKYDEESIVASFSMAKSVLSILVGIAIEEGLIKSIEEPITNYLPELKKNGLDKVTISHLLDMSSGIKFNESYSSPFGQAASFYYGTNLRREIRKMKLEHEPGTHFSYSSGDSQLLGLVLNAALKEKTITEYLNEKLWKPLGMEYDASWSKDRKRNGVEKTFCCLNARARDFAKIGRLYLNNGNWNGRQIVPEAWVQASIQPDNINGGGGFYENQWWLNEDGSYAAEGILGQYIYVNPKINLIIVRLGKKHGKTGNWESIFSLISEKYEEK